MSKPETAAPRLEGGLWCQEVMEALPELVEGTAPDALRAQVSAHLAACDWCARFGGAYGRTVAALGAGSLPSSLSARLDARLNAVLDAEG